MNKRKKSYIPTEISFCLGGVLEEEPSGCLPLSETLDFSGVFSSSLVAFGTGLLGTFPAMSGWFVLLHS